METQLGTPRSPSPPPTTRIKHFHPYFTPVEVQFLSEKQRGNASESVEERKRQQGCAIIEAIGSRMGFPRKTIATGQSLYHRFFLYHPLKDFMPEDVSVAALYVSTKMNDTLKKPRDILMAAYAVRHPELAAKAKTMGGEVEMDQNVVELDRRKLLAIEKKIMETICFNFTVRQPFPYIIKFGKGLRATKELGNLAWRLAIDSNRTLIVLTHPPHVVALGCLYLAALLTSFEGTQAPVTEGCRTSAELAELLSRPGDWESRYHSTASDLEDICHSLLDLLINATMLPTTNTSPSTPSSPSPHPSPRPPPSLPAPSPWSSSFLTRLKISLRETANELRKRSPLASADPTSGYQAMGTANPESEGTVRYRFAPPTEQR